jgi:hypothetical protein
MVSRTRGILILEILNTVRCDMSPQNLTSGFRVYQDVRLVSAVDFGNHFHLLPRSNRFQSTRVKAIYPTIDVQRLLIDLTVAHVME